jgi:hypothetical protein
MKMMNRAVLLLLLSLMMAGFYSCAKKESSSIKEKPALESVPEWSQRAIWYQIFVERLYN